MDLFLTWLESTAFSTWMREDPSIFAFPMILAVHTIGMALLVGVGVAIDLLVLGASPRVPVAEMRRFFPLMWTGFWLNVASGIALLVAYPTKALTNPVFFLKLALIAVALVILRSIRRRVFGDEGSGGPAPARVRLLAIGSMACWAGAIVAGRLLAYTYTRLTQTF